MAPVRQASPTVRRGRPALGARVGRRPPGGHRGRRRPASSATDRIELVQHAASAFAPGCCNCGFATARPGGPGRCSGPDPARPPRCPRRRPGRHGEARRRPRWRLALHLDPARTAWSWHVEVLNDGPTRREVDVVHAHDVALAAPGMLRTNELYVSQYLDITPLHGDGFGRRLAVRQNSPRRGDPVVRARLHHPGGRVGDRRARRPAGRLAPVGPPRVSVVTCRPDDGSTSTPSRRCRRPARRWSPVSASATSFAGLLVDDHPTATSTPTSGSSGRRWTSPAPRRRRFPSRSSAAPPPRARLPRPARTTGRTVAARPMTDAEVEQTLAAPGVPSSAGRTARCCRSSRPATSTW